MEIQFINYSKCGTCRKAKKWLEDNNISFIDRPIVEQKPNKEELQHWIESSGLLIAKFFNTSGRLYKEMNLKDKVKISSKEELLELLASDGMLVKRPILVKGDEILVGFKEEQWEEKLK